MSIDEDAFEEVNGIHRPKPGSNEIIEKMIRLWNKMEEEFTEEIVEYYVAEKYYHLVSDDPEFTICGTPMIQDPQEGRWVAGSQLQSERTPCPKCLKARMEMEESDCTSEDDYF